MQISRNASDVAINRKYVVSSLVRKTPVDGSPQPERIYNRAYMKEGGKKSPKGPTVDSPHGPDFDILGPSSVINNRPS